VAQHFRTFAAIELPKFVRDRIHNHIRQLRDSVPECHPSWSRVENIHLTLKFFGDVEQSRISTISAAAARSVKDFAPFETLIAGAGAFPRTTQPRVLWIGVDDPTRKLEELQQRFETECAAAGFAKEERAFRPHLTIARIRKPEGARQLAEFNNDLRFEPITLKVNELILFRSELSSQRSKYTPLVRYALACLDAE
jgi:2'-5' RNA ligase